MSASQTFTLVHAAPHQAQECYGLIEAGRAFQRAQGFVQWTDNYPQLTDIEHDIAAKRGYVLVNEAGDVAGYICIDFDGEPAYDTIHAGRWRLDAPSAVLHRMAMSPHFRGQGLADVLLTACGSVCVREGVPYIRADTCPENTRMQHVFERNGFVRCGLVTLRCADKIAYDKILEA